MKIQLLLGILCLSAAVAFAQETAPTPVAEVGLTYSFARVNPGGTVPSFNANGGSGYIQYNLNKVVGLVGDLGAYHNGSVSGLAPSNTTFSYLFGPRFNWRMSRMTPYVQTLVGGARLSSSFDPSLPAPAVGKSQNGFASALGGGVDVRLTDHIWVKPIQLEYFMAQVPASAGNLNHVQNNLRYSAGLTFRFGSK